MNRKLKLLKAILLLRKYNKTSTKEEQLKEADINYSDELLDEWIELLKDTDPDYVEVIDYIPDYEYDDEYVFYGPSNPWDAPGMCVGDFI